MTTTLIQAAEAATETAPAWTGLLDQLLPLAIGALLALVGTFISSKSRDKREDTVRWRELVRTLSAAILAHSERMQNLAIENHDLGMEMDDSISIKWNVANNLIKEREAIVQKASELSIIVPLSFTEAMYAYVKDAVTRADYESAERMEAAENIRGSRVEFMKEVRKYLGLPPAPLF